MISLDISRLAADAALKDKTAKFITSSFQIPVTNTAADFILKSDRGIVSAVGAAGNSSVYFYPYQDPSAINTEDPTRFFYGDLKLSMYWFSFIVAGTWSLTIELWPGPVNLPSRPVYYASPVINTPPGELAVINFDVPHMPIYKFRTHLTSSNAGNTLDLYTYAYWQGFSFRI
jgi:hypothetical protein